MHIANPDDFNQEIINLVSDERITHSMALSVFVIINFIANEEDHGKEVFFHEVSQDMGMQDTEIMKAIEQLTFAGYIR